MTINPAIFKAYDIRGVFPKHLNEDIAYRIGRAFVTLLDATKVVIGYDMRTSSPALFAALVRGVTEQGASVIDIGLVSSDMFYYATGTTGLPGIVVTASHNPPEYNGFKMVRRMPEFLSGGNGMEQLRDLVIEGRFEKAAQPGSLTRMDIREGFRQKVLSLINPRTLRPMKVVVDASNGMGGVAFDLVNDGLPLEVVKMYFEPDGTFPNHGGDPLLEKNRRELQQRVVSEGADLGFAFDPDADRFFAINSDGSFVPGDYMTALMGKYFMEKHGPGAIVYDTRASWAVRDLVLAAGGEAVEMRVGHAFIKRKMQEVNAVFGGEVTGHYYFRDFFCADSGVIPALILLELLGHYGKSLTELLAPLKEKYFLSGEINSRVQDPDVFLAGIKARYGKEFTIHELDGVSIIGKDWHANIRKSNTEPLVRLNVEGLSPRVMEQRRDEIMALIQG